MTPEQYAALRALQRKPKPARATSGAYVDKQRRKVGRAPVYTVKKAKKP